MKCSIRDEEGSNSDPHQDQKLEEPESVNKKEQQSR